MTPLEHAQRLHAESKVLIEQNRMPEAEAMCVRSLQIARGILDAPTVAVPIANDLVQILLRAGKYGAALQTATESKRLLDACQEMHAETATLLRLRTLALRGAALRVLARYEEAERDLTAAVAVAEEVFGAEDDQVAAALNELGILYKYSGNFGEAHAAYARAIAIQRRNGTDESMLCATLWHNLGGVFHAEGRYEEAEAPARRAWTMRMRTLGADHPDTVADYAALAGILDGLERWSETEPIHRATLAFWERLVGPEHYEVAVTLNNLGAVCDATGRFGEAEAHYRRAIEIKRALLGEGHPELALTLANLAAVLLRLHRVDEGRIAAEAAAESAIKARLDRDHPVRQHAEAVLGRFAAKLRG
jgi:tetratricopeptide (TPR) repeat protein